MNNSQDVGEESCIASQDDAVTKGLAKQSTGDEQAANTILKAHHKEHSQEYRTLDELREVGWQNPEGDKYFADQRRRADATNDGSEEGKAAAKGFYKLMQRIGHELHRATGAFSLPSSHPPEICDMCMAPGFLRVALKQNPLARATALSLPVEDGGHAILLPWHRSTEVKRIDITMLAADMGVNDVPDDHSDRHNFLPRQFNASQSFDLVLCDGHVLRTHERADYREGREGFRLKAAQLALGLEHLAEGGTMVVLLHGLESMSSAELVHRFSTFSSVQLFKPTLGHAKRQSFYMVAKQVKAESSQAAAAIREWKDMWRVATFGTDDEFKSFVHRDGSSAEALLESFGEKLVEMGRQVWSVQAQALAKAPFIKNRGANGNGGRKAEESLGA